MCTRIPCPLSTANVLSDFTRVGVADLDRFDTIIDVRSPSEYAHDHIPGAMSAPVLDDAERAEVGTLHRQVGAFEARRLGAALVAVNIARHLQTLFADRPRSWRPLVYCWRGGQRSGSMAEIFSRIGWKTAQLDGGYRDYRRAVLADLERLAAALELRIVCGVTGSGKSRLLRALDAAGAQVLDLEDMARHRGSVLGSLPEEPQPSQKRFETLVWDRLRRFTPGVPVFVEAESRKIGVLQVPEALMAAMRAAPCLRLELPREQRIDLLKEEYGHFLADARQLNERLTPLAPLHGHARLEEWRLLADAGRWDELVGRLLDEHYDPAYLRGMARNYARYETAPTLTLDERADFAAAARQALAMAGQAS